MNIDHMEHMKACKVMAATLISDSFCMSRQCVMLLYWYILHKIYIIKAVTVTALSIEVSI